MAKPIEEPSFWKTHETPDSWEGMLAYFRPRTAEELHDYFDVKPPTPPDPNEPPPEVERGQPGLLEQLRLTDVEFVELALIQPHLWKDEELDYLHTVAEEGKADEQLEELAKIYFSGERRQQKKPPPPVTSAKLDTTLEMPDLEIQTSSIPDLETLEGTMNVDRWWEKQKG